MCLGVFCLGFILFGTRWTWVIISFPILGKFFTIISSSIFSWSFFLSSSRTSMIQALGHLTLSQRSLRLSSFLLILFFFFLSASSISHGVMGPDAMILDLGDYFLPHCREVFNYYLLKYFLMVFLFVFFFWDSYDSNVGAFNIVPEGSEVVLISFNSFFFFPL